MPYSRFRNLVLLLASLTLISACTTLNEKVGGYFNMDTDLHLTFKVDADINPDDTRTPSPLFIRMYELKSDKMFKKADFITLFERDKEALGADMVAKQRLKRLKPGEGREDNFVLNEKTLYIGLYAEFLRYKNAKFKVIIPVVPHNVVGTRATMQISGNTIKVKEE